MNLFKGLRVTCEATRRKGRRVPVRPPRSWSPARGPHSLNEQQPVPLTLTSDKPLNLCEPFPQLSHVMTLRHPEEEMQITVHGSLSSLPKTHTISTTQSFRWSAPSRHTHSQLHGRLHLPPFCLISTDTLTTPPLTQGREAQPKPRFSVTLSTPPFLSCSCSLR